MIQRLTLLTVAGAVACSASLVFAQTAAPAPQKQAAAPAPKKVVVAKAMTKKPATPSRKQLESQAAGLALATATTQAISQSQLDIAARVLTGKADCEFDQSVDVQPLEGKPGMFKVGHKKASYTMVPEETTTGAVRLEDKKAGVVWLQIPSKSMLMNSKIGQRMVDACMHAEQRTAVSAAKAAGGSE